VTDIGAGSWLVQSPHTYHDNGSYTATITVSDDDGGQVVVHEAVTVTNAEPTLTISGPGGIDEGATYTLTLCASDPGEDTISQWHVDWGDGSAPQTLPGAATQATHVYEDGPTTCSIAASATDEDGTYSANSVDVTVANTPPDIYAWQLSPSDPSEGETVYLNVYFHERALAETMTVTVDWGDGSPVETMEYSNIGTHDWEAFTPEGHAYAEAGSYDILVTVTDEDGDSDDVLVPITVTID
jgi:hypothetical protein